MADEGMTEDAPEPGLEVHVIEDDEAEQRRKEELEARIDEFGEEIDEDEIGREAAPTGSPQTMIAEARKHLGYRETGDNDTKFNRWLGKIPSYPHGGFGYPWCHAFVSYCLWHSGNAGAGPRTAGCKQGVEWFRSNGRWSTTPKPGDLVYYGQGGGTHVELVAAVTPAAIRTIGGNTSGSLGGNYFNGDGVFEKDVSRTSSRIFGYGRPAYATGGSAAAAAAAGTFASVGGAAAKPMTSVRSIRQQQEAVNALGYTPKLDVDGEWGPKTEAGVKWLQKKIGSDPDGEWGQNTEAKYAAFRK